MPLVSAHAHIDPTIDTTWQSVVLTGCPHWTSQISNEAVVTHQARNPSGQFCFPALSNPSLSCLRIGLFAFYSYLVRFNVLSLMLKLTQVFVCFYDEIYLLSCFRFFGSTVLKLLMHHINIPYYCVLILFTIGHLSY